MYKTYHYNNMPVMRSSPKRHESAQIEERPHDTVPPPPLYDGREGSGYSSENEHITENKQSHSRDDVKCEITPSRENGGFLHDLFGGLKNDDIILLVIIFILLLDDCEDKLLLITLGFIFFSGLGQN